MSRVIAVDVEFYRQEMVGSSGPHHLGHARTDDVCGHRLLYGIGYQVPVLARLHAQGLLLGGELDAVGALAPLSCP